jgi:hypothetical protein
MHSVGRMQSFSVLKRVMDHWALKVNEWLNVPLYSTLVLHRDWKFGLLCSKFRRLYSWRFSSVGESIWLQYKKAYEVEMNWRLLCVEGQDILWLRLQMPLGSARISSVNFVSSFEEQYFLYLSFCFYKVRTSIWGEVKVARKAHCSALRIRLTVGLIIWIL